ncbi:hypothetical protein LEMLEM_LOCUS14885 [Lemmus lemmus]
MAYWEWCWSLETSNSNDTSSKAIPPNPPQTVPPTRDQIFNIYATPQGVDSYSDYHSAHFIEASGVYIQTYEQWLWAAQTVFWNCRHVRLTPQFI